MTSSSRIDPPGWITAVIPASAAANKPSEKGKLKDNLTSSLFPTFITEVGLYDDNQDLMGYARLSKPIPKSTSIPMRFFVRMDY